MSDGSTGSRPNDAELHAAQAEGDAVRAEADSVLDTAISQAAQRDAAELVARNAAYIRDATETALLNAKLRADQARSDASEAAEESRTLRERLVRERKAASNATFGLAIASVLLVIGSVAGGVYFFSSQGSAANSSSVGATPGVLASTSLPAKSSDVSGPEKTPTTINVNPAPAHEETAVPPETGESPALPAAVLSETDPKHLTGTRPAAYSGNLSGAALNRDKGDSGVGSDPAPGGVLTLPSSDAAPGLEPKGAHP